MLVASRNFISIVIDILAKAFLAGTFILLVLITVEVGNEMIKKTLGIDLIGKAREKWTTLHSHPK